METDLVVELEVAGERTRLRQEAVLRSSLPGILGRLHEAMYGLVAGSGLKQAVVAANSRMEPVDATERAALSPRGEAEASPDGLAGSSSRVPAL
jgi:hypothetical protein